jgi:hypothetical protein
MSNFAERLVARSAGRAADAGIPLLMPRPVARFEPTGLGGPGEGLGEDTVMISSGPADASPDGAYPAAGAPLRNVDASVERTDRPGAAIRPAGAAGDALRRPLPPGDASSNRGRDDRALSPPAAGAAASTPEAGDPVAMRDARPQPGGHDIRTDVEPQTPRPARAVIASEEATTAPAIRDTTMPSSPPASLEEQGGPVISIGKIEVQFLPKQTPPGLSRVQPQRTRGFHAYDRARRGLR